MKKLSYLFRWVLSKQVSNGETLTKNGMGHYYQKQHGHANYYKAIWSKNSKKALFESANRVSKICKTLNIKTLTSKNYLKNSKAIFAEEKKRGLGAGTMSQDMRFLNHYLVGHDVISFKDRLLKKNMDIEQRSSDIKQQRNKQENSVTWIKNHSNLFERWKEPIKFIQDTGLRRAELGGYKLYEVDNQLKVLTIGKNGKTRFADVLEGKESEVMRFSKVSSVPKISQDQANNLVKYKDQAQQAIKGYGQSIYLSRNIPSHIHRAYYAQKLVQELDAKHDYSQDTPYISRKGAVHSAGEDYSIGNFTAQYGAWREVSESLGHNRLEILKNYCGKGREN